MKYKKTSLLLIVCILFSIVCSTVYAVPATGTKLEIQSVAYTSRVLNVETSGTPSINDEVTTRTWSNNATQWWRTSYYATLGGISAYTVELYSYPTLYANYHQANGHCTLYTSANNSYHDYTIYWDYNGGYMMYLWYYNKFLHVASNYNGANCVWTSLSGAATNYEKWNVISNPTN